MEKRRKKSKDVEKTQTHVDLLWSERVSFQLRKRAWQMCLMDHFYQHGSKEEGLLAIYDTIFPFALPAFSYPRFRLEVLDAKQLNGELLQLLRYAALSMYYQPSQANINRLEFFKRLPLHPLLIQMYTTAPSTGGNAQFSMFIYILTAWVTTFTKRLKQQTLCSMMLPSNHPSFGFMFFITELVSLLYQECDFNFASHPEYLYIIETFLIFHRVDRIHMRSMQILISLIDMAVHFRTILPNYVTKNKAMTFAEMEAHYAFMEGSPFLNGTSVHQALVLSTLFDHKDCKPWLFIAEKLKFMIRRYELLPDPDGFYSIPEIARVLNEDAHSIVKMLYTLACQRNHMHPKECIAILEGISYSGYQSSDKKASSTKNNRPLGLRSVRNHKTKVYDVYCTRREVVPQYNPLPPL